MIKNDAVGLHLAEDEDHMLATIIEHDKRYSGKYRDSTTGQVLRDDLVEEARLKELAYFKEKGVWQKKLLREIKRAGHIPISVRWVDVNKGDDACPRYRSRLVARQLKARDTSGGSYFAPTPPLEALRAVVSLASTEVGAWKPDWNPTSSRRTQISCADISRAYFNAKTDEGSSTYVRLPPEDPEHLTHGGLLLRHMYGTRAAADGWQEEYSSFLVSVLGFTQGQSSVCAFRHPTKEIIMSAHGDDFTAVGAKEDLDWYEAALAEHYELTLQPRLGPGTEDAKEAVVLNRIIRWTDAGIEYEADPRQAEKLLAECGMLGVNSVATPGLRAGHCFDFMFSLSFYVNSCVRFSGVMLFFLW